MENLVIFGSLIDEIGQSSILQNLAFEKQNVRLFIVDQHLKRRFSESIVNNDAGLRLDRQTLIALERKENVKLVASHASEFYLPDYAVDNDTIFVYYRNRNSVGVNSEFDVMCLFNDFPRMYPATRRRYILADRSDPTDYSSVDIGDVKRPFDIFSQSGFMKIDQLGYSLGLVKQLIQALIEWLKSGFERKHTSNAFRATVNVYNRMLINGEISPLPRPNWVLNVETPSIKGLIYSAGLDYRDLTVENATGFTDGIKTQSLMLHSAEYRREVTFQAINLLKNFALENDLLEVSDDFESVDTWGKLLARM